MILIPEQVRIIRDEINDLEEKLEKNTNLYDRNYIKDDIRAKLEYLYTLLTESEFVIRPETEFIDYGTKFKIKYEDGEEETYTLAENEVGIDNSLYNYIAIDSPFGKALRGKHKNDNFSYKVSIRGKKDEIIINGKVLEIITKNKNDIAFLISRPMSERNARKRIVKEDLDTEKTAITLSQYKLLIEERKRLLNSWVNFEKYQDKIITGSIIKLKDKRGNIKEYKIVDKEFIDPKTEIKADSIVGKRLFNKIIGDKIEERITCKKNGKKVYGYYAGEIIEIDNSKIPRKESVYSNINQIDTRLNKVNNILSNATIITPPTDDKIGIGSKVSIMTFENGEVQTKRVEVIIKAVSSEDTRSYIEATSSLGAAIIGRKNNEKFNYYDNEIVCDAIVFDINNNDYDTLAKDPLTYQKRRKG